LSLNHYSCVVQRIKTENRADYWNEHYQAYEKIVAEDVLDAYIAAKILKVLIDLIGFLFAQRSQCSNARYGYSYEKENNDCDDTLFLRRRFSPET
jgi:hypothetical protein